MATVVSEPATVTAHPKPTTPPTSEGAAFADAFDAPRRDVSWPELGFGLAAVLEWFGLFAGGVLVGTTKYIEEMATGVEWSQHLWNSLMVLLFWTITNVGILSCLAAMIGALGRRTRFASRPSPAALGQARETDDVTVHYASALIRGFGVYALVLAGLLVVATDAMVKPDQGGYVRLAGLISVISFYAGYDPEMFAGFLDRVKRFIESK